MRLSLIATSYSTELQLMSKGREWGEWGQIVGRALWKLQNPYMLQFS